ncbi:MAG: hypothetical protein ACE5G8_06345 [Anaerolineae bacterium]
MINIVGGLGLLLFVAYLIISWLFLMQILSGENGHFWGLLMIAVAIAGVNAWLMNEFLFGLSISPVWLVLPLGLHIAALGWLAWKAIRNNDTTI